MQQGNPFNSLSSISGLSGGVGGVGGITPLTGFQSPMAAPSEDEIKSFSSTLADSMEHVNQSLDGAKQMTESLLKGDVENLHEVTIAGAKSEVMMKLTTTIVGKLAQATTQLFQMQI